MTSSERYSFAYWDQSDHARKLMSDLVTSTLKEFTNVEDFTANFLYGKEEGEDVYRENTAKFLTQMYGDKVKSENIFPTYGASFGYTLLQSHFFECRDTIFLEEVTCGGPVEMAHHYGLNVVPVSVDNGGIVLSDLQDKLLAWESSNPRGVTEAKPYRAMLYLINVAHNPLGYSYSDDLCKRIVELARKHNILVICDDVYNFYQYGEKQANRIVKFDKPESEPYERGHVVSNGTFSKILFPSIRLGWLECPSWFVKQFAKRGDSYTGGGFQTFNQRFVSSIIEKPEFIQRLTEFKEFSKKLQYKAYEILEKNIPEGVTFTRPECSFFTWIEMPKQYKSKDFLERLKPTGIWFMHGYANCSVVDGRYDHCFRLCLSNYSEEKLKINLEILCQELKKMIEN